MEKRVFLAVFLSFLVLYGYQSFFVKPVPPKPKVTTAAPAAPAGEMPTTAAPSPAMDANAPVANQVVTLEADTNEQDVTVETETVTAVFSNRGAVLKSWKLKHYLDDHKRPLELVPLGLAGTNPRPFSLDLGKPDLTRRLDAALFRLTSGSTTVDARQSAATLVFEYGEEGALRARKSYTIPPNSYTVALSVDVSDNGEAMNPVVRWGPALGDATAPTNGSSRYTQQPEGIFYHDKKIQRLKATDLAKQNVYAANFTFAGVDDHYFLTAAIKPGNLTIEYATVPLPPAGSTERHLVAYSARYPRAPSSARFFMGPKEIDVLKAVDEDLVRAINFGWFDFLVVPLLRSLKWINGYVGNYGWSIIILTILINAAMFPLRHKSVVSMRKMQELQPEVKAVQDRYAKFKATDPERQKMNQELMDLYRARGVNPASGCVPMLLTMPVLFAFYSLLSAAIEIRGARFFGWITDLSVHDPLYVTPILMGITMVIQQKMTPSTADPVQQRMMMVMPLVFTFMFLWAPSGLVLYWLVSNLWAIGQQHLTNRLIGPPLVRTVRPAAERRVKKLGGAKP
jgi:YidC/Oxa1 family membrane protein insertase